MQVPALDLNSIPAVRKARNTELRQFFADDQKSLAESATKWVRAVATQALADALQAGNPSDYIVGIDGTTRGGNVRQGFKPGSIAAATTAVRVEFIGSKLADIANGLLPILQNVIAETFPQSRTGALQSQWSWWVQRNRYAGGKNTTSTRLGQRVPDTVTIYDVLWLAPDFGPARYAWFANHNAIKSSGHSYNTLRKRSGETRLRKRLRGYLAEATRRMRGKRVPGVTIQGWIVKQPMTGPASRSRFGIPVVRVAFKSGLSRPVNA